MNRIALAAIGPNSRSPGSLAIRRRRLIRSIVVTALLVILVPLSGAPRPSARQPPPAPLQLCATPRATIDLVLPPIDFVPTLFTNVLIGSKFKFEVAFDNIQGGSTGFGPYLDVILPASGISGANSGAPPYDGISFDAALGATYLGSPIQPSRITTITFPPNTPSIPHPFTGLPVIAQPGDQLVVIELPFGNYTPQQPPAGIIVNAMLSNLADVDGWLRIKVQAGFRYGCSPTGNSGPLVSLPNPYDKGTIIPVLFTIDKTYDGPEIKPKLGETATGPNFFHTYTIAVNVAPGQTVKNLKVTDQLPNNLAFKQLTLPLFNTPLPPSPPVGVAKNNNFLTVLFPTIIGTGGKPKPDAEVAFEFFIPEKDGSNVPILNPTTGASAISENNVQVEAEWTPLDPRDQSGLQTLNPDGPEYTLVCKSIALQKKGINMSKVKANVGLPTTDNAPGDIIRYTLDFQISDYFIFNQLTVQDLISDGQTLEPLPVPTFTVTDKTPLNLSGAFTPANFTWTAPCPPGLTTLNFNLSGAMGPPGKLTGGYATNNPPKDVRAEGAIIFNTKIAEDYCSVPPSGDKSVDQNDKLSNKATIKGTILNNSNLLPLGPMQDDGGVDFKLLIGLLSKSIYAHTDRSGVQTLNPPASKLFAPGDQITFRLKYDLRHGDIEKFSIQDFLAQPVLNASLLVVAPLSPCGGNLPAPGTACLGPLNTLSLPAPGLTVNPPPVNPPSNSVKFDYGTFDDPASPPNGKMIDILFTLAIQNDPFVDGLFLANQILSSENNSFNDKTTEITAAQFKVAEPNLRIRKGVVATDNTGGAFSPGVTPAYNNGFSQWITSTVLSNANAIHSNLNNVDASDLVTFAVVVENLGSSPYGAFDVKVSDTMPPGFVVPGGGANLKVMDGTLPQIPFTGTAASFFTPAGIELTGDFLLAGALKPYDPISGKNIAVITYTLQVDSQVAPCQTLANTATIRNYSSTEQGPNYAASGYGGLYSDTRTVTIAQPTISQSLFGTNQAFTPGNNVTIGEEVTYEFTVTLPEGVTPSLTVTDQLPPGLQVIFVGPITGLSVPAPVITPSVPGGCGGGPVTLTFGAINVPDDNNPGNNWFKFQLKARVCNVPGNVGFVGSQNTLSNIATVASGNCQNNSKAVKMTVVEPKLSITKQFTPNLVPPNGTVEIKLVVTNSGTSPAYDVVVADPLPAATFSIIPPVVPPAGWVFNNITFTFTSQSGTSIPPNGTVTFIINATVRNGCGVLTNTAKITHATTLPGVFNYERDEPPASGSAGLIIQGVGCPCAPIPLGLLDWWPFDEAAGPIANDIRSFNNLGTYGTGSSAPTPTSGVVKNALCFDGANDYVEVADHPEVNFFGACNDPAAPVESFTIDVWVKTSVDKGLQVILDKRSGVSTGYHLFLSGGRVGFRWNGLNFIEPASGPNVADGQWHFIAVTVARCAGAIGRLYVDGSEVHSFTPPATSLVNTAKLQIGRRDPALGAIYFKGCLDELEIFKRALSAAELQAIYAAGSGGKCNATGCLAPTFAPAANYTVGANSRCVTVSDFNGDAKPDLAVANTNSGNVSILLGNGSGGFTGPVNFPTGSSPIFIAVGDFNQDGRRDLAVANFFASPNVSVLLGDGIGGFSAASTFSAGIAPTGIATDDLNSDGKLDLAVTNQGSNNVSILLGNGGGGFSAPVNFPVGATPMAVVIADFNGDGRLDLAVGSRDSTNVTVLLGNGLPSLFNPTPIFFVVGTGPEAVAAGDFNGDGRPDLAVANFLSGSVSILLGNGLPSLFTVSTFNAGSQQFSTIEVADFNCDGNSDLVEVNQNATCTIFLGDGTGQFTATPSFTTGNGLLVTAGDFNGDGKPDLAVTNPGGSVLLNTCACPCFLQSVTLQPTSQQVCSGTSATFTSAAIGNPSPAVQWQVSTNGGVTWTNIAGATNPSLTVSGPAGLYHAVYTNSCGTATTNAASLSYSPFQCLLDATERKFPASSGSGSVNVNAPDGTTWTAVSNASWITITSGNSGTGRGTVNYAVTRNPRGNPSRTGTITIAGKTFTVRQ